jgi:hypothetical protein
MNNTIKIVSLDPGITTGYASGVIEDGRLGAVSGQAKWKELDLFLQLEFSKPQIIIYERFDYRRGQDRAELFSRNLIGVINLWVQRREAAKSPIKVYEQMPHQVIGQYYTDKVLKDSKMYKVGNPHANDAMRHLLHWFTFGAGYQYNTGGFEPLA